MASKPFAVGHFVTFAVTDHICQSDPILGGDDVQRHSGRAAGMVELRGGAG